MDIFGKMAAIIICVLLLFFWPLLYMAQKQEMIIETYVLSKTASFVENVKSTGCITKNVYKEWLRHLDQTGCLYDIKMERMEPVFYQEDHIEEYKEHKKSTFEDDILEAVYGEEEVYQMRQGDYFSVSIVNRTPTLAAKLMNMIYYKGSITGSVSVSLGGAVRDEVD